MRVQSILSLLVVVYQSLFANGAPTVAGSGNVKDSNSQSVGKQQEGAITLTKRNFDSSIRDGNVWLIEFYSPWCGHCKKFAPIYESVAHTLHEANKGKDRKIMVGKIDGSTERSLSLRFGISAFPSFFLIDGWQIYEYPSNKIRSKESMIRFAKQQDKSLEPISFIVSPFGPFGLIRWLVMNTGTMLLDAYDYLVNTKSISPTLAAMLMASAGVIVGTIVILVVGLMLLPKPKID